VFQSLLHRQRCRKLWRNRLCCFFVSTTVLLGRSTFHVRWPCTNAGDRYESWR
jgi:hypothetical protein